MVLKTSYARLAALAAAVVAILLVMHARQRQPAAAIDSAAINSSENWPLGVHADNKEWLTFHEKMVSELRSSEKEKVNHRPKPPSFPPTPIIRPPRKHQPCYGAERVRGDAGLPDHLLRCELLLAARLGAVPAAERCAHQSDPAGVLLHSHAPLAC